MKSSLKQDTRTVTSPATSTPLSRRTVFAGAGTVGALAAAAALLPKVPPAASAVAGAGMPVDADGGYQLTEHVKRYYQTARV